MVIAGSADPKLYDVIVVGLGISTGPLVDCLASERPNLRLLILERGIEHDPARLPLAKHRDQVGGEQILVYRGSPSPEVASPWWTTSLAGGGSVLWYGQLSRFEDTDFRPLEYARTLQLSLPDSDLQDWPLGREEFIPYYDLIEKRLLPFGPPAEVNCDQECRHYRPRPYLSYIERQLISSFRAAQLRPYVGMTCLGGPEWSRRPVDPLTLEEIGSARSALDARPNYYSICYAQLKRLPACDIAFETEAVALLESDGSVKGVRARNRFRPDLIEEFRAPIVVIGCGPVETVKLLSTLSRSRRLLGKRFTFSTQAVAYIISDIQRSQAPSDILAGSFVNISLKDFYNAPFAGVVKGGKISVYDAIGFDGIAKTEGRLKRFGASGHSAISKSRTHYLLKVSFKGESIPWRGKYVGIDNDNTSARDVSTPAIRYEPHSHDMQLMSCTGTIFQRIAAAVPGGHVVGSMAPDDDFWLSAHQHGGAIFGPEPSSSVVDMWCEHHGYQGLFVVDGSVLPTSGATNSSLTIMANSLRVAHHIVQTRLPGRYQ